jgi:hypothetical protein
MHMHKQALTVCSGYSVTYIHEKYRCLQKDTQIYCKKHTGMLVKTMTHEQMFGSLKLTHSLCAAVTVVTYVPEKTDGSDIEKSKQKPFCYCMYTQYVR